MISRKSASRLWLLLLLMTAVAVGCSADQDDDGDDDDQDQCAGKDFVFDLELHFPDARVAGELSGVLSLNKSDGSVQGTLVIGDRVRCSAARWTLAA